MKKNSKHYLNISFLFALLFVVHTTFAKEPFYFCGYYIGEDATFYNLFHQENISQKAFYPFLRTDDSAFYATVKPIESENISLWNAYFDEKYTKEQLISLIYNDGKKDYLALLNNGKKEAKAKEYVKFAKACEKVAVKEEYSWDYTKILKTDVVDIAKLLEKGLLLFEKTTDQMLKIRYAYQIIRLYHYGELYTDAITFFENHITPLQAKNEIYYYALDQLAGCYYNTKQYEKAAYTFLTVFENSYDKKQSAFVSYKFCTYRGAEGKSLLKTPEEKGTQIFITALRNFSDSVQDLQKMMHLNVSEEKQELLAMRVINNLERTILNHYGNEHKNGLFNRTATSQNTIDALLAIVHQKLKNSPKNAEFWQLTNTYLSFLQGNISEAQEKLAITTSKKLTAQKEQLAIIYKVFSWKEITPENEAWLATVFDANKDIHVVDYCFKTPDDNNGQPCSLHSFVFKQLSHYYFYSNEFAKSFLLHNYLENVQGVSSHALVDDLMQLVEKPNKNPFEKLLLRSHQENWSTQTTLHFLKKEKGAIYFRNGNIDEALLYFKNSNEEATINAKVFSNNIMECFSCNDAMVMEDEVYKADIFSFLQQKMNKKEVLTHLQTLEGLANNEDEKPWKRKLANYLLGNYFFNVSNTGYYRTVTYKGFNYSYNYDFGKKPSSMDAIIANKETYYFKPVYNSYNALATKAKAYYKKTITLSSDNELNARCAYMIAKCELNDYYNNGWEYEYGFYDGSESNNFTNEGFEALKTTYKSTEFYKEIKSKCSFFSYYDAL